jgi:hypothetical protein
VTHRVAIEELQRGEWTFEVTDPRRRDDGSVLYAVGSRRAARQEAAWTYRSPTGDFAALDEW